MSKDEIRPETERAGRILNKQYFRTHQLHAVLNVTINRTLFHHNHLLGSGPQSSSFIAEFREYPAHSTEMCSIKLQSIV